jgi:hypothetical protein
MFRQTNDKQKFTQTQHHSSAPYSCFFLGNITTEKKKLSTGLVHVTMVKEFAEQLQSDPVQL